MYAARSLSYKTSKKARSLDCSLIKVDTYNVERLEHVLHVFEFFGFQGCVDAVDHVIVRLLFLLLHL